MQVSQYWDGRCRCVHWDLPDTGWQDVAQVIDPFLVQALDIMRREYACEPVEWLTINCWLDSGRLMVFPAQDGPNGNRGERVYFELKSTHLENETHRIADARTAEEREKGMRALGRKLWRRVGDCLLWGQASRQLAAARKIHRLRLAAFDYDFGEGLFRLSELDREAAAEMERVLKSSRRGRHSAE